MRRGGSTFSKKRALMKALGLSGRLISPLRARRQAPAEARNILLMELWGIGDVVLSTPAIIALKKIYPGSRLVYLGKPHAADVLKGCPHVDEFIPFDLPWTRLHGKYNILKWDRRALFRLIRTLRAKRFDLAIDVRGDIRSNLIMRLSGALSRVGYGAFDGDYTLTHEVERSIGIGPCHRVDEWHGIIRYLSPGAELPSPRLWVSDIEAQAALRRAGLKGKGGAIVGIHPGASNRSKKWGLEKYERLGRYLHEKYGARVVFFPDPDGYGSGLKTPGSITVAGWPLREMMSLIKRCDVFLCNDGGPMHIAAALGVPTAAVFGPTLSSWFRPFGDGNIVVEKDVCEYKPCWDYCRFERPACLEAVSFEDVISKAGELLSKALDRPAQARATVRPAT